MDRLTTRGSFTDSVKSRVSFAKNGAETFVADIDPLPVDIKPLASIYNNTKTVPTGTAEAIATSQTVNSVTIKALSTNTVAIYIGGTGVTTTTGFELLAGESVSLDVSNLATVFCISGSASQVIRYIAV